MMNYKVNKDQINFNYLSMSSRIIMLIGDLYASSKTFTRKNVKIYFIRFKKLPNNSASEHKVFLHIQKSLKKHSKGPKV